MKEILQEAQKLARDLQHRDATSKERLASHMMYQLFEYIRYLEEQDEINVKRIGVLKDLNSRYREHVTQLVNDTENLKSDLRVMTESNFAKL